MKDFKITTPAEPQASQPCLEPPEDPRIPETEEPTTPEENRLRRLSACMETQLTAELVLLCMESLGSLLEKLHGHGYVCLNLSPETILIGSDGTAALAPDCPITNQSAFAHPEPDLWFLPKSREYAAPEVLCFQGEYLERKRMARIGHRADIYSLGLLLCRYLFRVRAMTGNEKRRIQALLAQPLKKEDLSESFRCLPDAAAEELRKLLREMLIPVSVVRTIPMEKVLFRLRAVHTMIADSKKAR